MSSTPSDDGFSEDRQASYEHSEAGKFRWLDNAELEASGKMAKAWLDSHRDVVESMPTGTYVLIELKTGAYVSAADYLQARAAFDDRFGASALSFVHRVRMPTTVGGGWWALRSEA